MRKVATDTVISNGIMNKMFPIGAVYITANNVNPGTFLGGTWTSFGQGRTLVGVNSSDGDFNTALKTGGSKTVTLSTAQMPAHNHSGSSGSAGAHTHSVSTGSAGSHSHTASTGSAGAHTHAITRYFRGYEYKSDGYYALDGQSKVGSNTNTASAGDHTHSVSVANGGAHTHSGTAANAGGHTHTISIGNTGGGGSHTNVQPYITVYFWRRTA